MDTRIFSIINDTFKHIFGSSEEILRSVNRISQQFPHLIQSWEDWDYRSFLEEHLHQNYVTSFVMGFVKKLGSPYSLLRLSIDEICQYINRFLYIFLQEEYASCSTKYSWNFDTQLLKTQNTISPDISFITIRNFSLQKNLSICS